MTKIITLEEHSLDEANRQSLAEDVGLDGTINHERYYTQGKSFLSRARQLRDIDRLLRTIGFKADLTDFSLLKEIEDRFWGVGAQNTPYKRYSNGDERSSGTYIEILPTHGGFRTGTFCRGLTIDVVKEGCFEDYVWTCNLFRKLFGLKEGYVKEKRK